MTHPNLQVSELRASLGIRLYDTDNEIAQKLTRGDLIAVMTLSQIKLQGLTPLYKQTIRLARAELKRRQDDSEGEVWGDEP